MDYTILKAELTNDPLALGYSTMSDQQAADSLNTVNRTVLASVIGQERRLDFSDLATLLTPTEYETARGTLNAAVQSSMLIADNIKFLEIPKAGGGGLDFGVPTMQRFLDSIFASQTELRDKPKGFGNVTVSRATELGLGQMDSPIIQLARSQM